MVPYNGKAIQIMDEVNKVVIGKRVIIGKVLTAILAKGHILLEDHPGVGKTTLAKCIMNEKKTAVGQVFYDDIKIKNISSA